MPVTHMFVLQGLVSICLSNYRYNARLQRGKKQ